MMNVFSAIWGWVWKRVSPILTPIIGILIGILLISTLVLGYLYKNKLEDHAKLETEFVIVQEENRKLGESILSEQKKHKELQSKNEQSNQEFLDVKRELNKFKGREHVLEKKPGLTEKLIQKSFDELQDELSCLTGDKKSCKK